MKEVMQDHHLVERNYFYEKGDGLFLGKCPFCGKTKFWIYLRQESAWCTSRKCPDYMRKLNPRMFDHALRH